MRTWQLAGICVLLALVIFQGYLIQNLSAQLIAIQTQQTSLHGETVTRIDAILTAQQHEETVLLNAFCAELRDVRAVAAANHIPLKPLLNPPNARGFIQVAGCRVAVLP